MAGEEAQFVAPWLQYLAGGSFFVFMASSFVNIATKIRGNSKAPGPATRERPTACINDPKVIGSLLMMEDVKTTQADIKRHMQKVEIVHVKQNGTLDSILDESKKQTEHLETLVKNGGAK